ncbi:MAG: glycosyltransferase family 2 protein [Cytophagales bacterium]|nr:glycosyltransferase family 2 protein [Cytophagales bacterium]
MQPTPAISVVLPYFNAEKTLARAIESILNQTFQDFELILINNNSSDGSEKIASRFASIDHRVRLKPVKRQGVAHASNHGFELASAPLIARMDADDEMLPDRLEKQVNFLNAHPIIGLVGGQVEYHGADANEGFRHYVDWSNSLIQANDIFTNRFVELPIVNPTIMFRKHLFEKHGGYTDGDFPEDYEMILRWMEKGVQMGKIESPVLKWNDHPERLTRTDTRYSDTVFYQVKAKYLASWLTKEAPSKDIWIWGAGKLSRRRSSLLEDHGIQIKGYIDVKPRQLVLPCIDFKDIPEPGALFILSYVANRGKRKEIKQYLLEKGYKEGVDFLLVA